MKNFKICSRFFQGRKKIGAYIIVMIFLSLGLSFSLQSLLALTLSPVENPPAGNIFRRNGLINEGSDFANILSNAPMGILGDFQVGTNDFYVNSVNSRVSIGGTSPVTTLDLSANDLLRVGNYPNAGRPTCNSGLLGSIYYDTTANRPFVCTNTGWLYF